MINKSLNIVGYVFSILIILSSNSCIPWLDPEPCDTAIEKTIGNNDNFFITPLKNNYAIGDTITVMFSVNNLAKLENNENINYNLFENTNENRGILRGLENYQNIASLISSPINSININFGEEYNNGYALIYDSNLNKYILELEVILRTPRSYNINNFSFSLQLGNKSNNKESNCHFYEHKSIVQLNSAISFEVE